MKLYSCDKDGFNSEPVSDTAGIKHNEVFEIIPGLYEDHIKIVSISFVNPDGTADIKVEIDDPECDHLLTDYYFIR